MNEKLGFVVYGLEPKALFDGQNYFDEYLLQLSLNNSSLNTDEE
ncbi:MAG TPA: hypothetical protein PK268_08255 [Enterococcus sp.]|nr:hypothetical protein [Enterococcus sp.]HPR81852.1 hypothetical protein [Enterococcus sp.]